MEPTTNPAGAADAEADKFKAAATGSAAKADDKSNPSDNEGKKPSDEQKTAPEGTKSEPQAKGEDANKQEHDYKARYDGTAKDLKEKSEALQRTIDTNVTLAKKNPKYLSDLAQENPELADQVAQAAFGVDSYEAYDKDKKLEELKDSDPEEYEVQKRLSKLENTVKQSQKAAKGTFYESKGILQNQFDPKYTAIEKELKKLNPEYVEEHMAEALNIAYNIAYPEKVDPQKKDEADKERHLADQANKRGGSSATTGSAPSGGNGRFSDPEAKKFNDTFKDLVAK